MISRDYIKQVLFTGLKFLIGFPNGYSTSETKYFEAADALRNGADEVDTVVNVGWVNACPKV